MNYQLVTDIEEYPELEAEAEEVPANGDDRPVSSAPYDWTISALRDKFERGQIDLQPDFQRNYVWDLKPELAPRLVELLLLEIPIPPIYFGKMPGGRLEVIDGQQRLTALIKFVRNEFALQRLNRLPSINNKFFRELTEEHQARVLDATIRSIVIDAGHNHNLRYEVFERLNRGSMPLNEQELRNCVFRGKFCDLLAELEKDPWWRKVKGGDTPEPRFLEREMILRFFAFANSIDSYAGNLKKFLNDYMGIDAPKGPNQIKAHADLFRQTMQNVHIVFGSNAGHLYTVGSEDRPSTEGKWEAKFSISALDIQASALLGHSVRKVQDNADQIREAYIFYLLTNPQLRLAISRRPADKAATKLRWFGFKNEVQILLNTIPAEPRFFSFQTRQQLFNANPICMICKNPIHSFDDCAVDHIKSYSLGGKTELLNAQLVHRSCHARMHTQAPSGKIGNEALDEAQILLQVGYIPAAGSVAGVALEHHLKLLCDRQKPPLVYKRGDGISKINDSIKNSGIYDVTQWKQVQLMADIRNRCDHPTSNPPSRDEVDELIKKTRKLLAIFPI